MYCLKKIGFTLIISLLFYSIAITKTYAQIQENNFFSLVKEPILTNTQQQLVKNIFTKYNGATLSYAYILAEALKADKQVDVKLPDGNISINTSSLKIDIDKEVISYYGNTANSGTVDIAVIKNQVRGTIKQAGNTYIFYPLDDQLHLIIKTNTNSVDNFENCSKPEDIENRQVRGKISNQIYTKNSDACDNKLRILIVYTDDVAAIESDIKNYCKNIVAKMNTVNKNSKIDHTYELAYCAKIDYAETGKGAKDINNFRDMPDIKTLREKYSADVCIMLVSSLEVNGRAYRQKAKYDEAYAVVRYYASLTKTYKIFTHEVGHLYGCDHDLNHAWINEYEQGHAYTQFSVFPYFATIMYYSSGCNDEAGGDCEILPYFSDPDNTYKGKIIGDYSYANNANVMKIRAEAMMSMENIGNEGWADDVINKGEYGNVKAKIYVMNAPAPNIKDEKFLYNYKINAGGEADFISGNTVTLHPGFHAQYGSEFSASIQNVCSEDLLSEKVFAKVNTDISTFKNELPESVNSIINLYPNPFTDIINIKIDTKKISAKNIDIKVYDITGKLLLQPLQNSSRKELNSLYTINTTTLKAGMYYCIITLDGIQYVQKIIK